MSTHVFNSRLGAHLVHKSFVPLSPGSLKTDFHRTGLTDSVNKHTQVCDQTPRYLTDHFTTISSDVTSRLHLRSANYHQLIVPRCLLRPSGIFDRRSDGLELAAWQAQRHDVWFWQF